MGWGSCTKTIEASELPEGSMKTVRVGGDYVLLVHRKGSFYGMGAHCRHRQWDLSEGALNGTKVTCAGHGSVWDLTTGKGEFDEPLEDEPLYDVKEQEDGYLHVKKR